MARQEGPRSSGRARLRDVALRAGVSTATVSRVLNGSLTVRAAQRAQVLQAADELDYKPNLLARNLRRQQAGMIGVVISDIENPHFTQTVRAVEDAAYRMGYRVLLCNTDESAEKQRAYLEVLAAERVAGVVLTPSDPQGSEIRGLLDLGIPVVAFDRPVEDPRADLVATDNADAGSRATAYLLRAGHRRIGFIGDSRIETGVARLTGYREAMAAEGLTSRTAEGWSRIEGGVAAAEELFHGGLPSAIVLGNNLMAIGALRTLRAHGLRLPDQVAVVSIDNPFWAEIVEPPLTVLAQPVRRMAECVVELLRERLEDNRTQARRIIFPCELIERASAPPLPLPRREL